jgi:hypothetical protein
MTEPRASRHIPWARVVVEGAVVILSILLAFAIDAAWNARQLRARETEYLTALGVEMNLAAAELAEDHGRRNRWLSYSDSILRQFSGRSAPDSTVNIWIQQVGMQMTRFFPPSSVLNDLVSSGSLSALTSQELRFALLSYQRGRERVNFMEDWAREPDEDGLRPYLTQDFRWTSEAPLPLVDGRRLPVDRLEAVSLPEGSIGRMLNDPVFENLILIKRQRLGIVQRRSGQLIELIVDVINLIERELGK